MAKQMQLLLELWQTAKHIARMHGELPKLDILFGAALTHLLKLGQSGNVSLPSAEHNAEEIGFGFEQAKTSLYQSMLHTHADVRLWQPSLKGRPATSVSGHVIVELRVLASTGAYCRMQQHLLMERAQHTAVSASQCNGWHWHGRIWAASCRFDLHCAPLLRKSLSNACTCELTCGE